jgi:hypothetical protein
MSRRQRRTLSPNLFPFLAVLVCTLGTLILLLALVAQDAEESAEKLVESETQAASLVAEEERWEAEKLIEFRRQQTEDLERQRSELAHVEDHARRLREELETLRHEIEATEREDDASANEKTKARLASLRIQSEREKEMIRELEIDRDGRPPRVVIVPYKGSNGTDRRPIYLECTASAIIIQPEGVRITASQLDGPMGPGNPLDAALRAVRSHWQQTEPDSPPPYPLLLVRPTGVHAYAASRIAMSTWDDQFGYELIPEDLELAYPTKDPVLEVKLVEAIQDAVVRSRSRIAGAPSKYSRYAADAIAAGRGGGATSRLPNNQTANRGSNGSSRDEFPDSSTLAGYGFNDAPTRGMDNGTPASATALDRSALDRSGLDGTGSDSRLSGGQAGAGELTIDAADLMAKGTQQYGDQAYGDQASGDQASGTQLNGPQLNSPQPSNSQVSQTDGRPLGGTSGGSGSSNQAQANSAANVPGAMADPARAGSMTLSPPADPHEKTFSEALENALPSRNQNSSNQNSGSQNSDGSRPVLRAGNNWALPDSMLNQRGTSIIREMNLQCAENGFVLMPEGNAGQPKAFPIEDGLVEKSVMELATAIRDRVDRWGVALQNGRWEPVLRVRIAEGGDTRYRQLETMLRNSGIKVTKEPAR